MFGTWARFQAQFHFVLFEKVVKQLTTQGARGREGVGLGVVFQQHRTERLFCRATQHLRTTRRVVLAVVGAAMNQVTAFAGCLGVDRSTFAKADETQVFGGIHQLVRANGRKRHQAARRAHPTRPLVSLLLPRAQAGGQRRLAQVEQKHRRGFKRVMENIVGLRPQARGLDGLAHLIGEQHPAIRARLGVRRPGLPCQGGRQRASAQSTTLHEVTTVHALLLIDRQRPNPMAPTVKRKHWRAVNPTQK